MVLGLASTLQLIWNDYARLLPLIYAYLISMSPFLFQGKQQMFRFFKSV